MQGRYRNHADGFRSGYRSHNRGGRGGGGFGAKPNLPPPPPRKEEILMEAGRLAAEYLVFKGLLPASSIAPNQESPVGGRTSALDRLGLNPDSSRGRRRYGDEYGNQFSGRKRMCSYGRDYGGSDWGRRNRGYSDSMEVEDDYPPAYHRVRRSGFDHFPSRSELTGESGSDNHDLAEDTGSKASSSSTRKEPPTESDADLSKVGHGGRVASLETGDEVKSGDSKKRNAEGSDVSMCTVEGDGKYDSNLVKLCGFSKVPTRPRLAVSQQKSQDVDQEVDMEASNTAEVASHVANVADVDDPKEGSSSELLANQTDASKTEANDAPIILPTIPMEESVKSGQEAVIITDEQETGQKGEKTQREPSPEDEYSHSDTLRAKMSSPEGERSPMDEEMVAPIESDQEMDEAVVAPVALDQVKPIDGVHFPEVQPDLDVKLEEEKEMLPSSFKICDLNLTGTPEITEIPDDPVLEHLHPPASSLDTGKELSMDFGLSIGTHNNGTGDYSQLPSDDDKVVQVINLDCDSPVEANACDPSKPKDEQMIYPNLDNFLSHAEHVDLPGIQDGYSLALSEFLGTDISCCPSVPSDLNNLQAGMGLHDGEGVPNDDDSIYVSLGEIPIGFMEVWDQPPQDYGKFF